MTHAKRCLHDGAYCHHDCATADACLRLKHGAVLSSPHPGYPKEQQQPNLTTPWTDRELIWVGKVPFCYRALPGADGPEITAVHLAGDLCATMRWSTFRRMHPNARGPRRVRA